MNRQCYEGSRVHALVRRWETLSETIASSYRSSRLKGSLDRLGSVTRQSWLFRWLTAEPDPDVVVIDLTETWTVGPFIRLLDRLLPHGVRMWRGSMLRRGLERTSAELRDTPVQLASTFVLGVLIAQFAMTWASASRTSLGVLCLIATLPLLGLRVTWTWDELVESKVGQLATAVLVPPEPPDDDEDGH